MEQVRGLRQEKTVAEDYGFASCTGETPNLQKLDNQ